MFIIYNCFFNYYLYITIIYIINYKQNKIKRQNQKKQISLQFAQKKKKINIFKETFKHIYNSYLNYEFAVCNELIKIFLCVFTSLVRCLCFP